MSVSVSLLIALLPVGVFASLILTEGLLKSAMGINPLGAISWGSPLVVCVLIGTAVDFLVLSRAFKQKLSRRFLYSLLLANALCLSLAAYRTTVYVLAHPPEA